MGHELVREQHGLGVLHVGAARHHGAAGLFALLDQGVDEVKQESGDYAGVTAQPHANQAGDLVVAGTAGPELAAEFIAGNVIGKAERIEAFLRENPDHAPARESLEALREATPKPIAFDDLDFNLGERWIPKGVYERFASSLFDTEVKITFAST